MDKEETVVEQSQGPSLIMDNDASQEPQEGQEPHPLEADTERPEAEATEQPKEPEKPIQQTERLEDPGDFQPNDYSFDVELADGTKVTISKPEDFAKIPEDAAFKSPKDFMDVQTKYVRMVNGLENDKRTYEEKQESYSKQVEADKQVENTINTIFNEFAYLESNGGLPPVPAQYQDANWADPEVAKQPGVKERLDLLQLRKEENDKRAQFGLPPIGILEAKTLQENKAFKETAEKREQQQNDMRKKRGAMVAGQSAPAPATSNSDMIVGSGGSLRDLSY